MLIVAADEPLAVTATSAAVEPIFLLCPTSLFSRRCCTANFLFSRMSRSAGFGIPGAGVDSMVGSSGIGKMPRTLDGDKDWGDTKRLWAGVQIRRDGFKLKTHRRFREVEHGRWVKYEVTLPDAAAPAMRPPSRFMGSCGRSTQYRRNSVGRSILDRCSDEVHRQNPALEPGRQAFQHDDYGRDASSIWSSTASVGFFSDYGRSRLRLVIDPRIDQAQLVLERFEVNRVSHIGGDVAEQWGELMEEILVDRFVKKQNDRLVGKLNRSIEKERDDLRLSMAEWFAKW